MSADGKKVLYQAGGSWFIAAAAGKVQDGSGKLNPDAIEIYVDPRAEWRQMYEEAWRNSRDMFYDPGMHGADWHAIREKYRVFLPDLTSRDDLTRVLEWMVSELTVGHNGAFGGALFRERRSVPGGLLGADYAVENNRYRFKTVYAGEDWNPE